MNINSVLKKAKVMVLGLALLYVPMQAAAWGMTGHRIVGEVADYYLSKKARKSIQAILGSESIAMASNWADFIKSDTTFNHLGSWHYVNLPEGLDQQGVFNFLEADKNPNVYNKIPELVSVLKDKQSTIEQKKMAIRLLVHFVGDLHQPMHVGRKDDLGGNKFYVTWFGEKSNLHRVWDESLVENQHLSYTEYAAAINHPTKDQFKAWSSTTLKDEVYESYQVCNKIYTNTHMDEKLGYRYNFDNLYTLNEQLLKGGIRLASLLNGIYAK
jgi:hypothetical protein